MNAAERRLLSFELHRRFLENVTGRPFNLPVLTANKDGVVFASFGFVKTGTGLTSLTIESIAKNVKDLSE